MIQSASVFQALPRAGAALALFALVLSGCADMSESMTTAFADPAQFDLYDCKQLEAARKSLDSRAAELQGLMAKAETGFAGPVVGEIAYRNDYIAVRGQQHFAEEAWRRNKCHETAPAPAAAAQPATAAVKPAAHAKRKPPAGAASTVD
jgi:hypothetical protein